MTLKQTIIEAIKTIDECDKAVLILKQDPPLTLSFNDRKRFIEQFSMEGARALTQYYRLTRSFFNDQDVEKESA